MVDKWEIIKEKVRKVIQKLKTGRESGEDGMVPNLIKKGRSGNGSYAGHHEKNNKHRGSGKTIYLYRYTIKEN